jgi:hypothetical protein
MLSFVMSCPCAVVSGPVVCVLLFGGVAHADAFRLEIDSEIPSAAPGVLARIEDPSDATRHAARARMLADRVEWEIDAIAAADFHGTTVTGGGVSRHWFVADHVSVGVFGEVLHVNQDEANAIGAGAGVLLRWHFLELGAGSVFGEVGIGLNWFDDPVPAEGTQIDFSPRAAIGVQWALDRAAADGAMVSARVGWLHFSNAQTGEENPGIDALSLALGLHLPF